jgi:hypothetical protein
MDDPYFDKCKQNRQGFESYERQTGRCGMKDLNSDTFRCRFVIDKWEPEVEYRVLKKVAIGKWFFGVFTIYKYYWSNWIGER